MAECDCFQDRGDGVLVAGQHTLQITIEEVRAVVAGHVPGVRIEDPRGERIVVMGSFLHIDRTGAIYRLDHRGAEVGDTSTIHCVWPD